MWQHTDDAPRFAYHVWRSRFLTSSGIDAHVDTSVVVRLFRPAKDCWSFRRQSFGVTLHRESLNVLKIFEICWTCFKSLTFYTLFYTALRFPDGFSMDSLWLYGTWCWHVFDSTTTTGSLGPGEWCVRTEVWWLGSQTGRDPPTEDSRCLTVIHRQPQLTSTRFCWFFMLDPIEQRWTACRTRSVTTDHFKKNTKWTQSEHKVNRNSTRDDHRVTPSFPVSFSPSSTSTLRRLQADGAVAAHGVLHAAVRVFDLRWVASANLSVSSVKIRQISVRSFIKKYEKQPWQQLWSTTLSSLFPHSAAYTSIS